MATQDDADERQPLLRSEDDEGPQAAAAPSKARTPLPKAQLATVFFIKLLLPVASTQIAPYLNLMMETFPGSSKEKVGYYSGLVSSTHSLAHMLSIYPWSHLSDRVGRLPVLFIGTIGLAVFTTLFGLSNSLTGVLITRFLCGIFSGTTGAIHSVVGELTDTTNQGIAFPLYDIVAAVGFVIGPLIGGNLANPTKHPSWPWPPAKQSPTQMAMPSFSPFPINPLTSPSGITELFEEYPYLLPCLTTSALAVTAAILGLIFLDETLPTKRKKVDQAQVETSVVEPSGVSTESEPEPERPLPLRKLFQIPLILSICLSSFVLGGVAAAFNVVIVLVAYTDMNHGGLGLDPRRIGHALSLMGFISIFLKLSLTRILKPSGTPVSSLKSNLKPHFEDKATDIWIFAMRTWPITFIGFIVLHLVAKWLGADDGHEEGGISAVMWFAVSIVLFLSRLGCLGFTIIMILARDAAPNSSSLGATNGLMEFAQLIGITGAPVVVSSLFAFSITHDALGGYLWVLFCVISSAIGAVLAAQVRKYRQASFNSLSLRDRAS
ncbi:unnamed protein product [Somion occarium]|uniref:Major facilitator superfamily (MFS) profile domain-containing protein n=1 Tax=Somion occarium TaxID=3059160 RepID=A0ABP1DXY3_9APHY